ARVLSKNRELDEAIAEMKKAVNLAGNRADLHDELGSLLAQKRELKEAEEEFTRAIALDPNYAPSYLHAGVAKLAGNDIVNAVSFLRKYEEMTPNDGMGAYYLGSALEAQVEHQQAIDQYRRAVELHPTL